MRKYFKRFVILTTHKRMHTGKREYEYKTCGNYYISRCSCPTRHTRVHSRENTYKHKEWSHSIREFSVHRTHYQIHNRINPCKYVDVKYSSEALKISLYIGNLTLWEKSPHVRSVKNVFINAQTLGDTRESILERNLSKI